MGRFREMTQTVEMDAPDRPWQVVDREFSCDHAQTQFVKYVQINGVVVVRKQCLRCGKSLGNVAKNGFDVDSLPFFDQNRAESWQTKRQNRFNEIWEQQREAEAAKQQQEAQEWWREYNQYLKTQQWHTLRRKVLERDNNLCQACLTRPASQVHHLRYELYNLLGQSAAFECVAICYQCHVKIHPHMAELQHQIVASGYNPYLNGVQNGRI